MADTQLSIKLGSNNSIFNHDVPPKVRRSSFPLSRKRDFTLDAGAIVPVDLIETVPGDSFEISVRYILKTMPLVVAPFTSYKVRTHWYYCPLYYLWKGAPTFYTKGRSGAISLSAPMIKNFRSFISSESSDDDVVYSVPQSLSSYLGIPTQFIQTSSSNFPYFSYGDSDSSSIPGRSLPYNGLSALPFFMYQKIYRFAYVVPNLLQDNKVWFPDDISDGWRIKYDKSNIRLTSNNFYNNGSFVPDGFNNSQFSTDPLPAHSSPKVNDVAVNIFQLRYATFENDRFTTALPWSQRGQAPQIDVSIGASFTDMKIDIPASSFDSRFQYSSDGESWNDTYMEYTGSDVSISYSGTGSGILRSVSPTTDTRLDFTGQASVTGASFSLNQFRELVALSVWQERNARTQGDYNETVYAHFGHDPHHTDFEPIYIGGTSDIVYFGDVIQTSESTEGNPMGKEAGLGQLQASGDVGFFRADDYGYIMGVMIIQPETVYSQSIEKLWFREVQEDLFTPEDEGLGLQEILKGELMPTGTTSDNDLFGYQERNTEYKIRDNQAIGFFGLPPSVDAMFSAYSQSRQFASQPSLSHQFITMSPENMRRDMLAVPSYPMFKCTFASMIRGHRPMAYKSVPQTFGF